MRCFTILLACGWLLAFEGKSDFWSYFGGPVWYIAESFDSLSECKLLQKKIIDETKVIPKKTSDPIRKMSDRQFNMAYGLCVPTNFLQGRRVRHSSPWEIRREAGDIVKIVDEKGKVIWKAP